MGIGCICASVRAERTMASSMFQSIRNALRQLRVGGALFALPFVIIACRASALGSDVLPSGTYTYSIAERGNVESGSTIVVTRSPGTIVVSEHSVPMEGGEVTQRTFDETTHAAKNFTLGVDGKTYVTLTFAGASATLEQGGSTTTIAGTPNAPFAVLDPNVAGIFALPMQLQPPSSGRLTLVSLVMGTSTSLMTSAPGSASRPPHVPPTDASTDVVIDGKTGTLWYDPKSAVLDEFDLPAISFTFARTSYSAESRRLP